MKLQATNRKEVIKQIGSLIEDGLKSWVRAGQMIAEEFDADESFKEELCEATGISEDLFDRFYAIGKKHIYVPVLLMRGPAQKQVMSLPYALQERCCNKAIPVLIRKENGWDTLNAKAESLTSEQVNQVFGKGVIRSVEAQRAFIESANVRRFNPASESDAPWKIVGKRLVVKKDVTLTARELARILSEMES